MGDRIIFSCYGMVFSDGILFLLLEFQLGALSELSEDFGVESLGGPVWADEGCTQGHASEEGS